MSAQIIIGLEPSGEPGYVKVWVTTTVSGGEPLSAEETARALQSTLDGILSGNIVPNQERP